MIESLHSLARNPLPAITTLNLRSNRLISLAGIERLPSLERVDVRDNRLTDPTELARLTGVPEITEVYVHRNPFCKSYSNYRITIFNLFRKTPGYTEDIVIDSTGPTNNEKKQLVTRAPELPSVPVINPQLEDEGPPLPSSPKVVIALDGTSNLATTPKRTNSQHRPKSTQTGSQRRKKAPKRRVVELSHNEMAQSQQETNVLGLANPFEYIASTIEAPNSSNPAAAVDSEGVPEFDQPLAENVSGDPTKHLSPEDTGPFPTPQAGHQQLPPINTTLDVQQDIASSLEFDVSSDLYKKKIEALRQDFGNTWLSALGDETWDSKSVTSFPDGDYTSPTIGPTIPRSPSQGIASGGRTLG
jgi:hypothetical protein